MTDERPKIRPAVQSPDVAAKLRRPGDDIPNRPHLRVKARTPAGGDVAESAASLRRITSRSEAPAPADAKPEDVPEAEMAIREAKTLVMPPAPEASRNPFATHGPPPPDEKAEEAELAALTNRKSERTYSTGFILGIALVVVVVIGGVWLARLGKKVANLESRLSRIEGHQVQTAALDLPGP